MRRTNGELSRSRVALAGVLTTVVLVALAFVVSIGQAATGGASASAAQYEYPAYCLNGVSTNLPAPISASSVTAGDFTADITEELAQWILGNSSGVFFAGYHDGSIEAPGWYIVLFDPGSFLEPGYSTNTISTGACVAGGGGSSPTNVAVCKTLKRGDGTTGSFQQISVAEWNNPNGPYFDAPAANWVEGVGLTCDDPIGLGYKSAGYKVAWGGKPDPNNDPNGVRGAGMNNIYPYFTK